MAVNRFPLKPKPVGFNRNIYPNCPVIYKIVNVDNGEVYVGQTIKFRKRLCQHHNALSKGKHCSAYLQKSFDKHGVDKYYVEILEEVTRDTICEREIYWIEQLDSSNRDRGYNILVNVPSPWYGKRSKQHCENISKALMGKHPSGETRRKQSEARKGRFMGKDHPFSKTVVQYDKDMNIINTFDSISEASRKTEIIRTAIDNNLNGRSNTAGGFIWKYKEDSLCQV